MGGDAPTVIGVNPGVWDHNPQRLGVGSWSLHEILLYPIM